MEEYSLKHKLLTAFTNLAFLKHPERKTREFQI